MFPIKELPFELRSLIYPHALIVQHDNSAPNFLIALAADATLYAEVEPMYLAINATVTVESHDSFSKLKMSELMRIRHLRCVFPGPQAPGPQHLKIYKSLLHNNLLTATLDFSALDSHSRNHSQIQGSPYASFTDLVKQLLRASSCGLSQISIKFEPWIAAYAPYTDYGLETDVSYYSQENGARSKDIVALNRHLGITGRLERVVPADVVECWVWDGGKDGLRFLRWRDHPEVDKEVVAEGKVSTYERSARAWTRDLSIRREL
ncbi:hypothetical protein N431DRAFT_394414 [Stipitochalara longipes BDJ]|nr:hypothetical protein N431DRAFT_394414 [Stipitochalara longipes BDJ]